MIESANLTESRTRANLMRVRCLYAMAALILWGCILESEECGKQFVPREKRCVPAQPADDFGAGAAAESLDAAAKDGGGLDVVMDATTTQATLDAETVNPWDEFVQILIVDRTEDAAARQTPALPGADIDGLSIADETGVLIGTGDVIIDDRVNDPFMANIQLNSGAGLGPPDGRAVSLGTQGGFIRVGLGLDRPLRDGDIISIFEIAEAMGDQDRYEAFICRNDAEALRGCRVLGLAASGSTDFRLGSAD
ncbi:MAG: hypothetical protein CMH52_12250 [Myxococcales bacterium]|nr:hypothetical protein [Myxococcales bacterium]